MVKVRTAVSVNQPIDEVFTAFADFPRSAVVLHSAIQTEFLSPNTHGPGARWRHTSGNPDALTVAIHEVLEVQTPRLIVLTTDDESALETMRFEFTDQGQATLVRFEVAVKSKGFFVAVLAHLLKPMVRKAMTEDLERMKGAIEAGWESGNARGD